MAEAGVGEVFVSCALGVRLTCADEDGDSTQEGKQSHIFETVQHSLKPDSILGILVKARWHWLSDSVQKAKRATGKGLTAGVRRSGVASLVPLGETEPFRHLVAAFQLESSNGFWIEQNATRLLNFAHEIPDSFDFDQHEFL